MPKDRYDKRNSGAPGGEFSLEEILAEFGDKPAPPPREEKEDTIPFPAVTGKRPADRRKPAGGRVVDFPGAGGEELLFVLVEFVDSQGRRVPGVRRSLTAGVEGAASLQCFASADPITDEDTHSGTIRSFDGRAMAVLRTGREPGKATLTVSCEGLPPVSQALDIL